MTLKTAKKRHKELWDWLSKNPTKDKWDWPMWTHNGGKYQYVSIGCFACEIAGDNCYACPVAWPTKKCCQEDDKGLYDLYSMTKDNKKRSKIAAQIRDLPWKE
jgi:hypothetical protein